MTPRKPPPPARGPRPRTLQRIALVVLALIAAHRPSR